MSMISKNTALLTSIPSAPMFPGLETHLAKTAILKLRKVANVVEDWIQVTISGPGLTDEDPTITVDLTGGTFASQVAAETAGNWTISMGDSGLTAGAISYVSETQCTIATTGTCVAGIITIMVEAAALSTGYDSGTASYDTEAETSTCTSEPEIFFGTKVDPLDEDPSMTITLNKDAYLTKALAESLDSWTIDCGDTGLTVASITYVSERVVTIAFSGTAAAGSISVSVASSALVGARTGVSTSYTLGTAAWTDPGSFSQEALEGTVEVYQYLPGDDLASFVAEYSCPTGTGTICNIQLISTSAFSPKLRSSMVYDFGDAEDTANTIYAQLLLDV